MLKKLSSFKKMNFPQRKVFWIILTIGIAALLYFFGVQPLVEARRKAAEEITLKKKMIWKYDQYVKNRKMIEEELGRTVKLYEKVQQSLLPGETAQLGAVSLQEVIKRLSEKNGIGIRSFRILEPKEMNVYRKVSVQIDFNPVNSMLNLGQFLHDIEHHEKELMISEMDLLVMNPRMPANIQGSLVISGWMKGGKVKEKGREG